MAIDDPVGWIENAATKILRGGAVLIADGINFLFRRGMEWGNQPKKPTKEEQENIRVALTEAHE